MHELIVKGGFPRGLPHDGKLPSLFGGRSPPPPRDIGESFQCAIVWLHELGGTEIAWQERFSVLELSSGVGPCKWVWPRADIAPITANGGITMTSWFGINELPVTSIVKGVPDRPRVEESGEEVAIAVRRVHLVLEQLEAEGIPAAAIALGGFQQGAALALHSALRYPKRLAGCVCLSGWIPAAAEFPRQITDEGRGVEVFWGSGATDPVIALDSQEQGKRLLQKQGVSVTDHLEKRGHSVDTAELQMVMEWLSERLLKVARSVVEAVSLPSEVPVPGDSGDAADPTEGPAVQSADAKNSPAEGGVSTDQDSASAPGLEEEAGKETSGDATGRSDEVHGGGLCEDNTAALPLSRSEEQDSTLGVANEQDSTAAAPLDDVAPSTVLRTDVEAGLDGDQAGEASAAEV